MSDDEVRQKLISAIESLDFTNLLSVWVHRKTGGRYKIISFCMIERDLVPAVVYRNLANNLTWCRPISEFTDGRFVPEDDL